MRNKHQSAVIFIMLIILSACVNKKQNSSPVDGSTKQVDESLTVKNDDNIPQFELVKRKYYGTIAKSTVNDNNVNIRLFPSVSSKKIGSVNKGDIVEIRGFSNTRDKINNYEGYWLKVLVKDKDDGYYRDNFGCFGWIFSQFVDVDPSINVSTLKVLKVNPSTDSKIMTLNLEINRNGVKTETNVAPHKFDNQSFYTFVWSDDIDDFVYSDPVGTFKWNPETNEIQNITSMGSDSESAWCLVSDDYKYLFQDHGTSPGPRGLHVFDIETNKEVLSATYYRNLDYDGTAITIVNVYDWWNVKNKRIDEQSIIYAEKYIKDTPMTQENIDWKSQGGGVDVIVKYRFNLMTKESEYIECSYIRVQ